MDTPPTPTSSSMFKKEIPRVNSELSQLCAALETQLPAPEKVGEFRIEQNRFDGHHPHHLELRELENEEVFLHVDPQRVQKSAVIDKPGLDLEGLDLEGSDLEGSDFDNLSYLERAARLAPELSDERLADIEEAWSHVDQRRYQADQRRHRS